MSTQRPPSHPLGRPWGSQTETCGSCAWSRMAGPGPRVLRCLAAGKVRTQPLEQACDLWEAEPDCLRCNACCGAAFDAVEVSRRDPVRRTHPDLIIEIDGRLQIERTSDNRCVALQPDGRCRIYADRPRCCRDFEKLSANCILARRRLGLTSSWHR